MRRRWLLAAGAVVLLVVAVTAWSLYSNESPGDNSSELSGDALNDLRRGGWRKALAPHATLPIDPEVSAQVIAARIAEEYCGEPDVREVTHSNETTNDVRFFVPGCVPVDEGGEDRLDFPEAVLEVHPGDLPTVGVRGAGSCHVNVGARYEGFGLCVTDLLKGN